MKQISIVIILGLAVGFGISACTSKELRQASNILKNSNDNTSQLIGNAIAGTQKLSPEDERELGAELAGALIKIHGLHPNENLQKYVNVLGAYLAKRSGSPNLKWRFAVLNTEDINAFSTPAGFVLISYGLIKILNDEAELAGVLSHEIIHVTDKHHVVAIQKTSLAAGVANIGIIVEQNKKDQSGKSASKLMQVGAEVFARGLDKNDEYAADKKGILLSDKTGYDPYGLVRVLVRFSEMSPSEGKIALLFKTHPSSSDRLAEIEKSLGSQIDGRNVFAQFRNEFLTATR